MPARREARRLRRALPLIAAVALVPGCAAIFTRGQVEDTIGGPVGGAEVRILDEAGNALLARDRTDSHGCFFFSLRAPKGQKRFTLEVEAPGFRLARRDFARETDLLIVVLAPTAAEGESQVRIATSAERLDRWVPDCVPPMPPGAESLGPD